MDSGFFSSPPPPPREIPAPYFPTAENLPIDVRFLHMSHGGFVHELPGDGGVETASTLEDALTALQVATGTRPAAAR